MEENSFLKVYLKRMIPDAAPIPCGYCKDPITNIEKKTCYKYYLYLKSIPIDIYEDMVSKGWTRCGEAFYMTSYEKTCCKLYQPRLNINNFKLSNEQKRILKRFRKYLSGEYELNKLKNKEEIPQKTFIEDNYKDNIYKNINEFINSNIFLEILKKYSKNENEINIYLNKIKDTKIRRITNKKYNFDYSSDLIYIIKKIYFSLIDNNNKNNINQINDKESQEKYLNNLIKDIYVNLIQNYKSNEETILFDEQTGHINFKIKNQEEYNKFLDKINKNEKRRDNKIQKEETNGINKINDVKNYNINKKLDKELVKKEKYVLNYFQEIFTEPEIFLPLKHTYSIELSKNIILTETEERFLLYKKYEQTIHKQKEIPLYDHNQFWGNSILEKNKKIPLPSNLKEKTAHPELYPEFYGTYNLIHRIDNKIVAVTVVDILPHMLISDYCYYDPDYSFLDLGVITAIREIEYMKSFNSLIDNTFIYYSMGEICQSCKKLKYKGNYFPTEIRDHYTGQYIYLTEEIKKLIEDNKCHFLGNNKENSKCKYFSYFEIEDKIFNLMINIFGEKIYLDDFLNLYLEGQDIVKNNISFNLRRFLEIIDKDSFSKIEFYYE